MIDTPANLAMPKHESAFDTALAGSDDPAQTELDRLTASLDDLDYLSRSRGLVTYRGL